MTNKTILPNLREKQNKTKHNKSVNKTFILKQQTIDQTNDFHVNEYTNKQRKKEKKKKKKKKKKRNQQTIKQMYKQNIYCNQILLMFCIISYFLYITI